MNTHHKKAITGIPLIILILTSAIIGALLSYLWAVGYYENLKIRIPPRSDVTITNATFPPQNTKYFNVTIFNPSYAPSAANIKRITTLTQDGKIHNIPEVYTSRNETLPYTLPKATIDFPGSETFKCIWNWANHTGETIGIAAFIANGSGPTYEAQTPLVTLSIKDAKINPTVSVTRFNMTIENSNSSATHVDVTRIKVAPQKGAPETVIPLTPTLPYTLHPNDSVPLMCLWDWTNYQGENVTIIAETAQGYLAYYPKPPNRKTLPPPTHIQITDVYFDPANTTHFNVTVTNSEDSPTYVNITSIDLTIENETLTDLSVIPPPNLTYTLHPGTNVTFRCRWNWTDHREEMGEIYIHTSQDFTASRVIATTGRVSITITDAPFDVTDTRHFDLTIRNSQFSLEDHANITVISLDTDYADYIAVNHTSPDFTNYRLNRSDSVTFECEWDWTFYRGKEVNITVLAYGLNASYPSQITKRTPQAVILNITEVSFDLSDTNHFSVAVESSEFSVDYVLVTGISTTLEGGVVQNLTAVPLFPYVLHPNSSVNFECLWYWSSYEGENLTVTVYTLEGYTAVSASPMPFVITGVLFDVADLEHFVVAVEHAASSVADANVTRITVAVGEGVPLEITEVAPGLPFALRPDMSQSFSCAWNWTGYQGREVTVAVYTRQGYVAYASVTIEGVQVLAEVVSSGLDLVPRGVEGVFGGLWVGCLRVCVLLVARVYCMFQIGA